MTLADYLIPDWYTQWLATGEGDSRFSDDGVAF